MQTLLGFCVAIACFGALDARARTVRRTITLEEDEKKFIKEFDTFLEETEGKGKGTKAGSQPGEVTPDPGDASGLTQKAFISDMVLQTCLLSGVYLQPSTSTKTETLVTRLLRLLRTERSTGEPMPKKMKWEKDPLEVLEDADDQFRNLCITLFQLRRLNRNITKNIIRVRLAMKIIAEGTVHGYMKKYRDNAHMNRNAT